MTTNKDMPNSAARDFLKSRESKPGPHPLNPLDHLAFCLIVDAGEPVADALAALAQLRQEYVDWNEIRVARGQEVARTIGTLPSSEECAIRIIEEYNGFFEKRGCLSFDFLETSKVAEGRKQLHQLLPRLKKGAQSLLLYEFCPGASLPLSDEGLKAARKEGLVGKTGDRVQLGKALNEVLPLALVVRVLQYLELDATGHPYGEQPKPAAAKQPKAKKSATGKKTKRPARRQVLTKS